MDQIEKIQDELSAKYDFLSEEWYRIRHAIATGALRYIAPAFRVGGRRIYDRASLDLALADRKFGDDLPKARAHRGDPTTTLPVHLAPPVPQPGVLPFERAYALAHQENATLARLNKPAPQKTLSKPKGRWGWAYVLTPEGFERLGGILLDDENKRGSSTKGGER